MTTIAGTLPAGAELPRHQHATPYVTLVVRGSYVEAGDHGRFTVGPGDVLVHGKFASHANWIDVRHDVETLNFELTEAPTTAPLCASARAEDVVCLSKSDPAAAMRVLLRSLMPKVIPQTDWPDILASAIRDDPTRPVSHWCRSLDLAPGTVSRGFKRSFGVSVAQYRATARARGSYHALMHSDMALIDIADHFDFSDQAHFTRAIRALTGAPPSYWRQGQKHQGAEQLADHAWRGDGEGGATGR